MIFDLIFFNQMLLDCNFLKSLDFSQLRKSVFPARLVDLVSPLLEEPQPEDFQVGYFSLGCVLRGEDKTTSCGYFELKLDCVPRSKQVCSSYLCNQEPTESPKLDP